MSKATGIFLILAGVGTAALILPAVDKDAERQLAEVVRIATGGVPQTVVAAPEPAKATPPVASAQAVVAPVKPAAVHADVSPPAVIIAPPQLVVRNSNAPSARPSDGDARADLARDIQRELKRVGCYDGEVTGEWSSGTRRAMKTFVDRVNAALPIDEPDHILRTMVQGHPGGACGKGCAAGQTAGADGRCQPAVIVAQKAPSRDVATSDAGTARAAVTKAVPKEAKATTTAANIATGALPAGSSVPKPTWETTVTAAPQAPLPGNETRMAIGAPTPPVDAAVGPRTSSNNSEAISGNGVEVVIPGAIAALATSAATATVSAPGARGPRIPVVRKDTSDRQIKIEKSDKRDAQQPKIVAALPEKEAVPAAKVEAAKPVSPPVAKVERPSPPPQRVVRRLEAPQPYRYPAPYFVGVQVPKVFYGGNKPERSSFNVRIYERFSRELR